MLTTDAQACADAQAVRYALNAGPRTPHELQRTTTLSCRRVICALRYLDKMCEVWTVLEPHPTRMGHVRRYVLADCMELLD